MGFLVTVFGLFFGWLRAPRTVLGDRLGFFWLVAGSKNGSWRPPSSFLSICGHKILSFVTAIFLFKRLRAQNPLLCDRHLPF
jgi:hypothetical protein